MCLEKAWGAVCMYIRVRCHTVCIDAVNTGSVSCEQEMLLLDTLAGLNWGCFLIKLFFYELLFP